MNHKEYPAAEFDHDVIPTEEGRHPVYSGLVMADVEQHHGMLILRIEGAEGNALISWEDWVHMVDGDLDRAETEFAYIDDEYLGILER